MATPTLPVQPESRKLTQQEFHVLAEVPPELEWFAGLPPVIDPW